MTVEEFREKAVEENGLFIVREQQTDEEGVVRESVSYYQDAKGRLSLSQVDTGRQMAHHTTGVRTCIAKENVIVDRGGFRVAWKGDSCERRRLEAADRNVGAATDQT